MDKFDIEFGGVIGVGEEKNCIVQCLCRVLRRCCRSVVILGCVTVRRVEHSVFTRCSSEVWAEGRCVCSHVRRARWYPKTNIPQS
jgi:hypothetical protein